MHEKKEKIIAKFDYKEKLALGCLYMKDKFLIQDCSNIFRSFNIMTHILLLLNYES